MKKEKLTVLLTVVILTIIIIAAIVYQVNKKEDTEQKTINKIENITSKEEDTTTIGSKDSNETGTTIDEIGWIKGNLNNFDENVERADKKVLVYFTADWCYYCKVMKPEIDAFVKENKEKYVFYKINGDENAELVRRFRVAGYPTLFVMENGEVVNKVVGAKTKAELAKLME